MQVITKLHFFEGLSISCAILNSTSNQMCFALRKILYWQNKLQVIL